jgi:hypothetical protein
MRQVREIEVEEEDQILQTKIVSNAEFRRETKRWKSDIDSLFKAKKALRVIGKQEAGRLLEEGKVVPSPSKVVFALKPDPNNCKRKRKCRIVACGSYTPPQEEADYFAAGSGATSLQAALAMASQRAWVGIDLDIKTAFLNARIKPFEDEEAKEEEERHALLRPPAILVNLCFFPSQLREAMGFGNRRNHGLITEMER